jgi:hypothetical protein
VNLQKRLLPVPAWPSESEDDELIPESEYHRGYKRRHPPDRDDYDGWGDKRRLPDGDLVVFHDGKPYLTDAQRFMADTGSFQFCMDLNGEVVSIDEVETPQSTLIALHMNRLSGKHHNAKDDMSWRLGEAVVSDDELKLIHACFKAEGVANRKAKAKAKIKKSKEASTTEE